MSLFNVPSLWPFVITALQTNKKKEKKRERKKNMLFLKFNCPHFLWYQIHISYYEVQKFSMVLGLYNPFLFFPVHLFNTSFSYNFMHDGLLYHYSLGSVNLPILIYNGISMSVNYYKARLNPHLPVPLQFPTPSSLPCLSFHLSAFMGLPPH